VAVSAGEVLLRVSRSVAQAATHRIAGSERSIAAAMVAKANRASFAIIVAASAVAFIAAPWAVDVLYGMRFHQAGDAIRILLPGIAAVSCSGILGTYFTYQMSRPIALLYISIMNAVVETALCFVLVPRYQINGAALASTLMYLNAAVVFTWYFCKNSGLSPAEVWLPTLADVRAVVLAIRPDGGPLSDRNSVAAGVRVPAGLRMTAVSSQDFVICGWTEPSDGQKHFGALLLGVFDRGTLIYAGHADAGFDEATLSSLHEMLAPLEMTRCPFRMVPTINSPAHWVKPILVAGVKFGDWPREGVLHEPVYVGLRTDKAPEECVRTPRADEPLHESS
jgi:hypothetical protein